MDEIANGTETFDCDVLVIGGGTAGPMAAYKAKKKNPDATVVLLEKANVKRSGAISMGMDGSDEWWEWKNGARHRCSQNQARVESDALATGSGGTTTL